MSTYCISDIHGYKKEFEAMLDKIKFSSNDDLYILGDLIDRGPENADLLLWAIEEASDNVHFLLGNHEDMMYSALISNPGIEYISKDDPWILNGGDQTLKELYHSVDNRWIEYTLLPWIENLPVFKKIIVDDKPFMLVHAGFNPKLFDSVPLKRRIEDTTCDYNPNPNARKGKLRIGNGFGIQDIQNMLWQRQTWLESEKTLPYDVICGHTYIKTEYIKTLNMKDNFFNCSGGTGRIAHIGNKHIIDCGCANAKEANDFDIEQYNLACLRLDDMKEFYIPCRLGMY